MKINRTRNTINNVIFGFINKFITIIFPFAIRTIIINVLGVQYLGLGSLFTSILNILSLAELGFGTALVYSMYKPIAEDDTETVNALLNLYKKIYRIIGVIVLFGGLLFLPFLSKFIKGSYPSDINLYTLYLVYLSNTCISYFFFAYRSSLFAAHQRNDVSSKISTIAHLIIYGCQIAVLLLFKNYYVYIIFLPLCSILINLSTLIVTKKMFPQYTCRGTITSESKIKIKKQIYALFLHRIGYVVQSSIDNICISAFMGLTLLGKFNNYYYVMSSIMAFITIFKQSMIAGIGNSLIVETKEYNKKQFYKTLFIMSWVIGWCSTCLLCLYQPFMNIWVKKVNMLPFSVVICLVVLFFITEIRGTVGVYKDALGMWYQDRFKPICISVFNLIITIISAYFGWFEGIILATASAYLFVGVPWETHIFFKYYMNEKPYKYYLKQGFYLIVNCIALLITYTLTNLIKTEGIVGLIYKGLICLVVPNIIFILANLKSKDFNRIIKNKGGVMGKIKKCLRRIYNKLPKIIKDPELRDFNQKYNKMVKLEKKHVKQINKNLKCEGNASNYIFTCWLQGEENAPELVKVCFNSMRKCFKNKELVVITEKNLDQYTNFPAHILDKWKKGIITNTHFSDLLRAELLAKHGGVWIDATVFCTGNIDKYINKDTDLFVFKNEHRGKNSICLSSWFIYAKPNNPIIVNTRDILYKYWEKNNSLVEYFLFHIIFTICVKHFKEEWERVPFFTNLDPHVLWFYSFYEPFNQERFNQIKQMSNLHKLSYKFDPKKLKEDSFYDHLIKGDYE